MLRVRAQFSFFDTPRVVRSVDRMRRRELARAGGFVRTTSRRSIRKRKGTSLPGRTPHSHTGDLKKIYFGYDDATDSTVVGPLGFKKSNAPSTLEHGGFTLIRRRDPKTGHVTRKRVFIKKRPYMEPALMKARTFSRAPSYASVVSFASVWMPRCTLA